MKEIQLTPKEVKILTELLSLDMDNIGFNDREQTVLRGIYDKLTKSITKNKVQSPKPITIEKFKK